MNLEINKIKSIFTFEITTFMVRKIVIQSVILFSLFLMQINAQISLSSIKNAGIKSEQDLINLGVSRTEIDRLKNDFTNSQAS